MNRRLMTVLTGSICLLGYVLAANAQPESFFRGPAQKILIVVEVLSIIVLIAVAWFLWQLGKRSSEKKKRGKAESEAGRQ